MSKRGSQALTLGLELGLAAWFLVSVLSQHPQRSFDKFRKFDKIGLVIPNWRFFAPEPAVHDFHVLYRTQDQTGDIGPWSEAFSVEERRLRHAVWFPGRRKEKAVFDVAIDLMSLLAADEQTRQQTPSYQLVSSAIRRSIRQNPEAAGAEYFQFMIVLYSGYDETGDPQYRFVSSRVRVDPVAAMPAAVMVEGADG